MGDVRLHEPRATPLTVTDERWRTTLALSVATDSTDTSPRVLAQMLRREADRLEMAASRFRADSEVALVNRSAGTWVEISDYLNEVLRACLDAAAATDGLTNPCLGREVDAAGYRGWAMGAEHPADGALQPAAADVPGLDDAWRAVEVVQATGRYLVRIPPTCQLDLGAVAKGWLADRLATMVDELLGLDVVANMGGDLRVIARRPWTVGIDLGIGSVGEAAFDLADAGVATSSQARRRWYTADGAAHHLIDPRTGEPARTPWWSVSVVAQTATEANAAATAAMVLGERAPAWLTRLGLDAWLVAHDPEATRPPSIRTVGRWPHRPAAQQTAKAGVA